MCRSPSGFISCSYGLLERKCTIFDMKYDTWNGTSFEQLVRKAVETRGWSFYRPLAAWRNKGIATPSPYTCKSDLHLPSSSVVDNSLVSYSLFSDNASRSFPTFSFSHRPPWGKHLGPTALALFTQCNKFTPLSDYLNLDRVLWPSMYSQKSRAPWLTHWIGFRSSPPSRSPDYVVWIWSFRPFCMPSSSPIALFVFPILCWSTRSVDIS